MKKLLASLVLLGVLGFSTAFAGGEVYIQGGQFDSNGIKSTGGAIGYGFSGYSHGKSGLLYGTSMFFGGSSKNIFYGADGRLGLSTGSLGVYGIGSAMIETVKASRSSESENYYGFGYGAGVEYKYKKIVFALEYKTYSMDSGSSEKTTTEHKNILLKYRF